MKDMIPTLPQVVRETIVVLIGAFIAVSLVRMLPAKYQQFFRLNNNVGVQQ